MISKRIDARRDGKSSALQALSYCEGLSVEIDRETGELLDKSHRTRLGNFGLINDGVYVDRDVSEMAELIELAALEMQSNCDLNTRVKADHRLAHFIFSFNQEKPSEAVLRDTEDSALAALKVDQNHFATFLHNDNGYWHLHLVASRIDKTPAHRGNDLWHDKIKRDKVCREIEIRHGLERDNGFHEIDSDGRIVEVPRDERRRRQAEKHGISDKARVTEKYGGEKSFQTWCNDIRIGDRLKHAKSWRDLHAAAAAYGCVVRQKGAGFVICPVGQDGGIQLSKVGLKNLPARFGAFAPREIEDQAVPVTEYEPLPIKTGNPSLYVTWKQARDTYKGTKTDALNELRRSQQHTRAALRERHKRELATVRASMKGEARIAAVSVTKFQHAAELEALALAFAADRKQKRLELAGAGPGNTYRDFLVAQAAAGNEDALALARKYGAGESTSVARQREINQLQIVATASGPGNNIVPRLRYTHRVEGSGTVVFDLGRGRIITDSALSKQVQLNAAAAADPDAVAQSLRFAQAKFGSTLALTGSPEFQRMAVETSVRKGLNCKFADPALEAYREKFASEQKAAFAKPIIVQKEYHNVSHPRKQHARQIPPPHRRDRLHHLSDVDVVLVAGRNELLLRQDVLGRVEQRQEESRHQGVQRPAGRSGGAAGNAGRPSIPADQVRLGATFPSSNAGRSPDQVPFAAPMPEAAVKEPLDREAIAREERCAASHAAAEKWIAEVGQGVAVPLSSMDSYFGRVAYADAVYAIQSLGRHVFVIHAQEALASRLIVSEAPITVRYNAAVEGSVADQQVKGRPKDQTQNPR